MIEDNGEVASLSQYDVTDPDQTEQLTTGAEENSRFNTRLASLLTLTLPSIMNK